MYEYSPHWLTRAAPDEPAPTERVCRSLATLWGHVVDRDATEMTDALENADRRIRLAAQRTLLHAAPFSTEECAAFTGPLVVDSAETLRGLEAFPNLRSLGLVACRLSDLRALAPLGRLEVLKVACCPLTSTAGLASLPALTTLELGFGLLTEAPDVLAHPTLQSAALYAHPFSDEARAALLADARCRLSPEEHWDLAVALHALGIELTYGALPGKPPTLVAPGPGAVADFIERATPGMNKFHVLFDCFPATEPDEGDARRFMTPLP